MSFGVLMHREDSIYQDSPAIQYQFPKMYLSRAKALVGQWIVYLEPSKVKHTRGYFGVAKISHVEPDPRIEGMFIAFIEAGSYVDFAKYVPFSIEGKYLERGLLNEKHKLSGRAQAAVRPISQIDFNRILHIGLDEVDALLPRLETQPSNKEISAPEQEPYILENERDTQLVARSVRDRIFRRTILSAYDERCAVTGLKLINGGGRAEVEAAHIRSVSSGGPDSVSNGIALSGTAHWMLDRGLISVSDTFDILVSRHVNDLDSVIGLINSSGKLVGPSLMRDQPHPAFLKWHRDNVYKH